MPKRKVSCTFKRKKTLDFQERIYPLRDYFVAVEAHRARSKRKPADCNLGSLRYQLQASNTIGPRSLLRHPLYRCAACRDSKLWSPGLD